MPARTLTKGTLLIGDRPDWVHPGQYPSEVARYTPLGQDWPVTFVLDKMRQGDPATSRTKHFANKGFNLLSGRISDIYTDTGFVSAHSGAAASGATVVVRPHADDVNLMLNVRVGNQVKIHSGSVYGAVGGTCTGVNYSGALASFTFTLDEADTNSVLAGTSLTWLVMQKGETEVHELGDAVNLHENDLFNYVYTDSEPFAMSEPEMSEFSRIENGIEQKKKERELDALIALSQRREFTVLEGIRKLATTANGKQWYAGGLEWFLKAAQVADTTLANRLIVDWRTDTLFSDATDTVAGGTLPMLRRVLSDARKWKRTGLSMWWVCSQTILDLIDDCVTRSGQYRIESGTNKYGLNVKYLRGRGEDIELVEDALFEHYPFLQRRSYILVPEYMHRHQMTEGLPIPRKKGLRYIKWSAQKDGSASIDGQSYITEIKGGWEASETFTFDFLEAFKIIDNLGLDKA